MACLHPPLPLHPPLCLPFTLPALSSRGLHFAVAYRVPRPSERKWPQLRRKSPPGAQKDDRLRRLLLFIYFLLPFPRRLHPYTRSYSLDWGQLFSFYSTFLLNYSFGAFFFLLSRPLLVRLQASPRGTLFFFPRLPGGGKNAGKFPDAGWVQLNGVIHGKDGIVLGHWERCLSNLLEHLFFFLFFGGVSFREVSPLSCVDCCFISPPAAVVKEALQRDSQLGITTV